MKRNLLTLIVLAALTVLMRGTPSAAEGNAQDTCTLKTIKGTYLFQAHGVVLSDGEALAYAEAGTWTLDGKGNATGVFTALAPVGTETLTFHLYTTLSGKTMTYFSPGFSGTLVRQ